MSAKARTLTKLLSSATTYSDPTAKNLTRSAITSAGQEVNLKNYIRFTEAPDSSSSSSSSSSHLKPSQSDKSLSSKPLSEIAVESIRIDNAASISDAKSELCGRINSILCGDVDDSPASDEHILDVPWLPTISQSSASLRRKENTRFRKQKWVYNCSQGNHFGRLLRLCTHKLGTKATINVFGRLGRETGVKEFNAMIEVCIEKARNTNDEDVTLEEFHRAYMVFETMKERGFQIGEETYGPLLMFIIDMGMVEEFHFFCDNIKKENPKSLSKLAYYEMLLYIKVGNEDNIHMLLADTHGSDASNFNESYLAALCEGDRQEEVLMLLETIDIKKVSLKESRERIFKSLGRLTLESHAKKFIMELKTVDNEGKELSNLIYSYAKSIPNIPIEEFLVKFKNLQDELKVASSSISYEKLIKASCESLEVHLAVDLIDSMFEDGLTVRINMFNTLLTSCYASCDYNLVYRIKSMIDDHDIKANAETYRSMISLCVKMKDFDGAYGMIKDLGRLNMCPTVNMYNVIMGGYFRQKNFNKALMVLKQMEASGLNPDSHTFSYIIGNCSSEDDIIKYRKELDESGVTATKHIYMALINAYAACGLFEKAKQVLSDKKIPKDSLNEIKSVLVSALASQGQMTNALEIYDEIKQDAADLEPKSIICLIEHLQSEGELSRLLQLLKQLKDFDFWDDGCARIILYCVRHKLLGSAVDLLKQRMEKCTNETATEGLFDEVFCAIVETEPIDVQFGLDLLQAIKEDIGIRPSRRSLDFLLSACVNARDLDRSFIVWKEYQTAGLPYNVLTFVRMYQALLASGAHKAAKPRQSQGGKEEDEEKESEVEVRSRLLATHTN
ncbi:pentatricopeptide repeat-containing protein At4g04790, mitochondrial-like isoform X2 [Cynara cardunculus var. scolymus]|uniref:pentatricopeptide repeat-containing protein At4g04790, mitochondrial-like isoform X2 n=1 Tax=Cynara cardunculus var. scolymus TaxID=59895 RepID=UPI000D631676|nr:pentatricopeptide repeat-containing protein At4g04790, mitochondrial-like isoform X2 [Cynara cardunculus var. scolymus]